MWALKNEGHGRLDKTTSAHDPGIQVGLTFFRAVVRHVRRVGIAGWEKHKNA